MSIKITTVFYPHIVKEYATIDQLITENGYDEFYAWTRNVVGQFIDITDDAQYLEALTDDMFEGTATMVFPSQAVLDQYEAASNHDSEDFKLPIFAEPATDHII